MMTDHIHKDYATSSNTTCSTCDETIDVCAYCNENLHTCLVEVDSRIPPGYRVIPDFPDYMVNKQATIKHIKTQRYCMLLRVSKQGGAMINVQKDGKKFTRAAQDLRDSVFSISKAD